MSVLDKLFDVLDKHHYDKPLHVRNISRSINCSAAYVSQNLKMAKMVGFIKVDIEGTMFRTNPFPEREIFLSKVREASSKYRKHLNGKFAEKLDIQNEVTDKSKSINHTDSGNQAISSVNHLAEEYLKSLKSRSAAHAQISELKEKLKKALILIKKYKAISEEDD